MFGEECVDFSDGKNISVTVDGKTVHICLETRVRRFHPDTLPHRAMVLVPSHCFFPLFRPQSVCYEDESTEDDSLREMVELAVQRLYDALNPVI